MATVNSRTLDQMQRITYFVKTSANGLVQLPFELVTIDADFQAYQPLPGTVRDERGKPRRGRVVGSVILDKSLSLPRAPAGKRQDAYGVWEFRGR